jgi:cytochrome c553
MKKFIKWTLILFGGLIGLIILASLALYPAGMKKLAQTYPNIQVETITIPTRSDAIANGEHIAHVWECAKCHGDDLSGKLITNDPILGTIPSSNLTSGRGGIASTYTDADWIRAIRHGVKPDGRGEVIMYNYSTMSDQDLGDLIAYLKQIPPVDSNHPVMNLGPILPIAPAVGFLTPAAGLIDHGAPRPVDPAPGSTIEYGKYLSVLCTECHSNQLTGIAGKVKNWTQADFIRTFQTSVLPDGKQFNPAMKNFNEMNDTELTALWLYLQTLRAKPQ